MNFKENKPRNSFTLSVGKDVGRRGYGLFW